MMLNVGDKAPDFSLPNADMEMISLSSLLDKLLVVYFYPKDDTPGCTVQANEFSDLMAQIEAAGGRVVGVSPDDCFSHQAFRDKFGLNVNLLADVDREAAKAFDAFKRDNDGNVIGILRSTFIIDAEGTIRYVEYGVTPRGHAEKMLLEIGKLNA